MHNEFTYILEPPIDDDPFFLAFCPEVTEANGQGSTAEDAVASLREAIAMILNILAPSGVR
jgi:predicted RNase H-like HicB family nuclease